MNGLDITGRRFTRLYVVGFSHNNSRRNYWKCKCDCGKEKIIQTQSLIDGRSRSCGCIHRKDLTNERFGMLVALELSTEKSQHSRYWKCRCDCGKIKDVNQNRLISKKTTSCGCNHFRIGKEHSKWDGCGDMAGSFFGTIRSGAKSRGLVFLITKEEIWDLFLKQNRKCALTGLDLKFSTYSGGNDGNASLDRINSDLGYTIDNIQWVHKDINIMKMDLSNEELIKYCKLILEGSGYECNKKYIMGG